MAIRMLLVIIVSILSAMTGCQKQKVQAEKKNIETKSIRIAIVGDSTVADYPANDPLRGWGQLLPEFFNENVSIINFAKCGESSKSFIKNGLWQKALDCRADYYLIQFGHNDCPGKGERTTDPNSDYQDYLTKYITDVRAQGARPVLVTSMERRVFYKDGTSRLTLDKYADAVKKVGLRCNVPVVDLHDRSVELYQNLGDTGSAYLMTCFDRTHFIEPGARRMARIVAEELRTQMPDLNNYNIVDKIAASDPGTASNVLPGDITIGEDNTHFIFAGTNRRFVPWGFNCDLDEWGRAKWVENWPNIVEQFRDIKSLGANVMRVHLQTTKIMTSPEEPNQQALANFDQVLKLAENMGVYLDITGLACYNPEDVPAWYNDMNEPQRWAVQGKFWKAVSKLCAGSNAVFCYDLMNEPVVTPDPCDKDWLTGEFYGKTYVQRITRNLSGRTEPQTARAWVDTLVSAIRLYDRRHMITVGEIPWAIEWPGAKPFFASEAIGRNLDFASIHVYPKKGKIDQAIQAVQDHRLGKPVVVEELFALDCSLDEVDHFIDGTRNIAAGWISHYWRKPYEPSPEIDQAMKNWLKYFEKKTPQILGHESVNVSKDGQ